MGAATPEFRSEIGKCPACRVEGVKLHNVSGIMVCEKCSSKRFSAKVRVAIQEAFERQQEAKQREAWQQRIEVAKRGVQLYAQSNLPEALKCFREYIAILELRYSVGQGGLHVNLFDPKKDSGEILLIAGIYWDMAKIFDQFSGHQVELRVCLNKFIEFSIGRPHIILTAEAIRKHIAASKTKHTQDFKNAHALAQANLSKCFVATAVFGPLSEEVRILRDFRDHFLRRFFLGRLFIRFYYKASPPIAVFLSARPRKAARARLLMRPLMILIKSFHGTRRG